MKKRKPGGGRKPKYNEPTETIAFRVPKSHKESVKKIVDDYLKPLTTHQIKQTRCYVNMYHEKREKFLEVVMSVDNNLK